MKFHTDKRSFIKQVSYYWHIGELKSVLINLTSWLMEIHIFFSLQNSCFLSLKRCQIFYTSYVNETDLLRGYGRILWRNNNKKLHLYYLFIVVFRSCTFLAFQTCVRMYSKICKDGHGENTSHLVSKRN